jgi:putative two-component system response regulator
MPLFTIRSSPLTILKALPGLPGGAMESTYDQQIASIGDRTHLSRGIDDDRQSDALVVALSAVVKMRDRNTLGHCQRLAARAVATGAHLGLAVDEIHVLYRGGYLHDLGKIAIPDAILLKPGRLTATEFAMMKLHTVFGDAICGRLPLLHPLRPIVRWHHERLDGTGYPDGLTGDRIPLVAQIVGIADVYDALTSVRPYKAAVSPAMACDELMHEVEIGWRRRDLVEAFIAAVAERELAAAAA